MGGSSQPTPPTVGEQLSGAINTLSNQGGQLATAEGKIDPQMTQINDADTIQQISQLTPQYFSEASQAQGQYEGNQSQFSAYNAQQLNTSGTVDTAILNNNNYGIQPLRSAANNFLGTGVDPTLSGLEQFSASNPTAAGVNSTNNFVQGQLGTTSPLQGLTSLSAAMQIANPQNQATKIAAASSAQQTALDGTNMVSRATQANAVNQLALGSGLSQQQIDLAAQTSRAADSARGVFHSGGSAASEVLNTDQYGQQLLQQREGNANTVASELNSEQGTANTMAINTGTLESQNQSVANNMLQTADSLAQQEQQQKTGNAVSMSGLMQGALQSNIGQAVNTQATGLSNQFNYQNAGINQLSTLAGIGEQNSLSGAQLSLTPNPAFGGATQANSLTQIAPNTAPSVMNSLNLFGASQQSSNQAFGAQEANAQQQQQAQTAMVGGGIAAGASIAAAGLIAL